ncbi:uncharacterized protein LOC120219500 isoform X2 [Hibiscus syriacus]|uniref:uncharacterized protein LOC120219500 isoform X2 n=1 Tax=Hibiscus syriacus TaxID=106335 RepID=UPI001923C10C|nr:uncharacterized protein LOC120219500 isoform X2 [Hibiscus syriacus]
MLNQFRTRIQSSTRSNPFNSFSSPVQTLIPKSSKTLKMSTLQTDGKPRRLVCPTCSKPARVCLCNRIRTRNLDNSVSVTILQHSSERNHPLNSTRIAKLGLKNLNVVTVSEVDFEARFEIRLLEPCLESGLGMVGPESSGVVQVLGKEESRKSGFESFGLEVEGNGKCPDEKNGNLNEKNGEFTPFSLENDVSRNQNGVNYFKSVDFFKGLDVPSGDGLLSELTGKEYDVAKGSVAMENPCEKLDEGSNFDDTNKPVRGDRIDFDRNGTVCRDREGPVIGATMVKYGNVIDLSHIWKVDINGKKLKFEHILESTGAKEALSCGFVVKKLGRRKSDGKMEVEVEVEENEEFEVKVPRGSVLLFPSQDAVGVDELQSMHFEVKNLIVLDGTWSKAGRVYNENPWLKLLPHLRLDLDKMSLYSEIRHQPKAGCLSTIESIVYTLKALGDNADELDNLLDVFESMVGDQRRLKDERLSKRSKE